MATEIIITGTGFPVPHALRAGPGVLLRAAGLNLQFDAGRSTTQRITGADVSIGDITAFFATHHHSDHLVGLSDLVMTRWNMARGAVLAPLDLVVPSGPCERFVNAMLASWVDDIEVRMLHMGRSAGPQTNVVAFDHPAALTPVWQRDGVTVLAGPVRHEPVHPAVGYRVETPDGVVAITGDTLVCDEVGLLADGADVLVYEAMRFEAVQSWPDALHPIMNYHADSRLIGAQAEACGVSTLVLTHLIPPPDTEDDRQLYVDDIRNGGFTGELVVANDLDVIHVQ